MIPVSARSFWMSIPTSSSVPRMRGKVWVLPSMVIVAPDVVCCAAGVVMQGLQQGASARMGREKRLANVVGSMCRSPAACHGSTSGTKAASGLASIHRRVRPISLQMGNPLRQEDHDEAERILRLIELDRARGQVRRSRGRRAARTARVGFVGALVTALLIGLFYFALRWVLGFFSRGTSWRQ